ncbi:PEP-CTERM sorting domain-containing protein [Methylococcaceae bacterium WWC4]|nr:PEP-CTERM sorting domain-containing protein [Methylococcaceae bacterium WWC4]
MKFKNSAQSIAAALVIGGLSFSAEAALVDMGGGLLYDNVLDVTWLQDANYAHTTGYSATGVDTTTGRMTWDAANTWATNLVYHDSVRNVDYGGWQLASALPVNGVSYNMTRAFDGSTDNGFNITSQNSMLMYMLYVNLGLIGVVDTSGNFTYHDGPYGNGTYPANFNVPVIGLVHDLMTKPYWSSEYDATTAFIGNMSGGGQATNPKTNQYFAWAVHQGNIAAVPVPGAVWLFGTGLLGLLGLRRK